MGKEMSAKDKAFEKERAKYRKEIRETQYELKKKCIEVIDLSNQLKSKDKEIEALNERIEFLLNCVNMSESELNEYISVLNAKAHLQEMVNPFMRAFM